MEGDGRGIKTNIERDFNVKTQRKGRKCQEKERRKKKRRDARKTKR